MIFKFTMAANFFHSIDIKDRDTQIVLGASAIGAVATGYAVKRLIRVRRERAPIPAGAFPASDLPKDCYDAVIVGAGAWLLEVAGEAGAI